MVRTAHIGIDKTGGSIALAPIQVHDDIGSTIDTFILQILFQGVGVVLPERVSTTRGGC